MSEPVKITVTVAANGYFVEAPVRTAYNFDRPDHLRTKELIFKGPEKVAAWIGACLKADEETLHRLLTQI